MIKRIPNFRSRALRSSLELSTDSQEKIKVTPSSVTESDNISGLDCIGNSSAKDTKTPDAFFIEIPDKYILNLPYLTRQLNRKIWQGYQGTYRVS